MSKIGDSLPNKGYMRLNKNTPKPSRCTKKSHWGEPTCDCGKITLAKPSELPKFADLEDFKDWFSTAYLHDKQEIVKSVNLFPELVAALQKLHKQNFWELHPSKPMDKFNVPCWLCELLERARAR